MIFITENSLISCSSNDYQLRLDSQGNQYSILLDAHGTTYYLIKDFGSMFPDELSEFPVLVIGILFDRIIDLVEEGASVISMAGVFDWSLNYLKEKSGIGNLDDESERGD